MSVRGKLLKRSRLLQAKDGDVLVIRYGGKSTARDAHAFGVALNEALRDMGQPIPKLRAVIAPVGVDWSLEPAP